MGGTISSLYSRLFGKVEKKIVMVGFDAAGKTTILYRMKTGETIVVNPTIGFNLETVEYNRFSFIVIDAGHNKSVWRHFYQNTEAIIFVVDSTDRERIEEAEGELHKLFTDLNLKEALILILANKQDMSNAMTIAELTDKLKLKTIQNQWHIQATCAIKGEGLFEGMDWLSNELLTK